VALLVYFSMKQLLTSIQEVPLYWAAAYLLFGVLITRIPSYVDWCAEFAPKFFIVVSIGLLFGGFYSIFGTDKLPIGDYNAILRFFVSLLPRSFAQGYPIIVFLLFIPFGFAVMVISCLIALAGGIFLFASVIWVPLGLFLFPGTVSALFHYGHYLIVPHPAEMAYKLARQEGASITDTASAVADVMAKGRRSGKALPAAWQSDNLRRRVEAFTKKVHAENAFMEALIENLKTRARLGD